MEFKVRLRVNVMGCMYQYTQYTVQWRGTDFKKKSIHITINNKKCYK